MLLFFFWHSRCNIIAHLYYCREACVTGIHKHELKRDTWRIKIFYFLSSVGRYAYPSSSEHTSSCQFITYTLQKLMKSNTMVLPFMMFIEFSFWSNWFREMLFQLRGHFGKCSLHYCWTVLFYTEWCFCYWAYSHWYKYCGQNNRNTLVSTM